ncbi:MAG: hypothetical protein M3R02_04695 [Chloroflexota bacterium]|nr:hypothetical protein [Chloroflexota bacterium]
MALPVLIPDHPLDESNPELLRRSLLPFVPATAAVCGTESALFRLLTRAVFDPDDRPEVAAKRLRLARFALTQVPEQTRAKLQAWPHAICCPLEGDRDRPT